MTKIDPDPKHREHHNVWEAMNDVRALGFRNATRGFGWVSIWGEGGYRTWDEVEAAHPGREWCTFEGSTGHQSWFAADEAPEFVTIRGKRKKRRIGRPCEVGVSGHGYGNSSMCSRPAVEPAVFDRDMGREVRCCKLHASAKARREKAAADRRAKTAERLAAYDRDTQNAKASRDWVARLRDEFDIEADECGGQTLRVKINPERLYAILVDAAGVYHDAGLTPPWEVP